MKVLFAVALACLSLTLMTDASFAAKKKMTVVAGGACTTGATCATNCEPNGWCTRYVCVGSKWEKRLPGCSQPFCGGSAC